MEKRKYNLFSFRLPWDQHSVEGWLMEVIFCLITVGFFVFVNPSFLTFFISICEYHRAFYKMFQGQINEVDVMVQMRPCQYQAVKKMLHQSISFHVSAKNLFDESASIYSTFIAIQLIANVGSLACSVFQMDLVINLNVNQMHFP